MISKSNYKISIEIQNALKKKKPIVALESTLISHGLPYPQNLKVAKSSINIIKKNGVVPATIAIIEGKIKFGLNDKDLEILAKNTNIEKVSMNNLSLPLIKKSHAATTVASTIYLASLIGIKFFSTGGIGGVHLNSERTFDISADLHELSKTKMFIISSGPKSILDINKTFEYLETLGITRIGYKTNYMPGFWYHKTNKKVDHNFTNINELSNFLKIHEKLINNRAVLIFNLIPKSKSINMELIQKWIKKSIKNSKKDKIKGKELTPYLIKKINKLSKNETLKANIEIINNNALLAAKLAYDYYK